MPPNIEDDDIATRDAPYQHRLDEPSAESFNSHQSADHQSAENNSTNEPQLESTKPRPYPIPFLERLRKLPALRSIPWRMGQDLPPERSTESPRVQQRGACLLATRGKVMENPCSHCAAGLGRFTACITLDHWFQGACSTCIFTSKGNKCSLRIQTLGKTDGRALRYHSFELGIDGAHITGLDQPQTSKKRKRQKQSLAGTSVYQGGAGSSHLPVSPDLESSRHTETTYEDPSGLLGYVLEKEQKQKWHNQFVGVVQDASRDRSANIGRSSRYTTSAGTYGSGREAMTDISSAKSAGPQMAQMIRDVQPTARHNPTTEAGARPEWARNDGGQPIPLIDTFSKAKQRQMFGLLSGFQGGIDHLQRQLNLLQASLGIDVEDSEVEKPSRIGTQWMP